MPWPYKCVLAVLQEEFMSAFSEQVRTLRRQEEVQVALESCTDDMEKWGPSHQACNAITPASMPQSYLAVYDAWSMS